MTGDTLPCLDEDAVQAYVERRMSADQRARVERHLDSCVDCRRLVSSMVQLYAGGQAVDDELATELGVTESLSGVPTDLPLQRGDAVGRYVILDFLGAGGMGVVHSAYDPELDRKIALKLLRPSTADRAHAQMGRVRLLREAKTMARVSHPNVVSVYDAGTYGERVFLAMEFVEGTTLRHWLKDRDRPWRKTLDVFVQAGRGLAAAHAAGLVHRDFKPENVLIGPNERVLVTDFGLARGGLSTEGTLELPPEPEPEPPPARPLEAQPSANTTLTITGQVLGTPAYMAPEQHAGKLASPKADQFSFCVALYEGLYGERPYPGDSTEVLLSSLASGKIPSAPSGAQVPASLRRILLRGLRPDPDERFPSMDALLDALTERPRVGRRRALALGAAGVLVVAGLAVSLRPARSELCRGAERKLAGVWDPARKNAVRQLFVATGRATAEDTWARIEQTVDAYTHAWTAMHTEACEATRVRGEQSDEVLSLRMLCLDRRLSEVKALAQVLGTGSPDSQVLDNAVKSAQALTPLDGCADVAALKAQVPPPRDPDSRAKVEALRARLAEAKALSETGKYARGLELMRSMMDEVRAVRYPPLLAEALVQLAQLQDRTGDAKAAEQTYYEAIIAGEAGHEDRLVAKVWSTLVHVVGARQGRHELGLLLAKPANAALARFGGDVEMEGALAGNIGNVLVQAGKYAEALPYHQQSLATCEKVFGAQGIRTAAAVNNLAADYYGLERFDEAITGYKQSLEMRKAVLGPRHPDVATVLHNLGVVHMTQRRYAEAEAYYRESMSIREETLTPNHPAIASSLNSLAVVLCEQGKFAEGEPLHRRALAIGEKVLGPEHRDLATFFHDFAAALTAQGKHAEACALAKKSVAIREKVLGVDDVAVALSLRAQAMCLSGLGKHDEALAALRRAASIHPPDEHRDRREHLKTYAVMGKVLEAKRQYRQALAVYEDALKLLPPSDLDAPLPLTGLGNAYLALGEPKKAVEPLERALKLREQWQGDPLEVVELRFALARAIWGARQDRAQARELAIKAKDGYASLGERGRKGAEQVRRWLAQAAAGKK